MRSINPYEIQITPHRDFESRSHRTSFNGGRK